MITVFLVLVISSAGGVSQLECLAYTDPRRTAWVPRWENDKCQNMQFEHIPMVIQDLDLN
jgi:hypothetical protein